MISKKQEYNYDIIRGIFLLLLAISGNFIAETLSCKSQQLLTNNMYAKHFITILILYFTIGFISKDDKPMHPYKTFELCIYIYVFFLIFTKLNIYFTIITFLLIVTIYINFTFLDYYRKTNDKPELIKTYETREKYMYNALYTLLIIGFIINFAKHYKSNKKHWNFFKYIFDIKKCV